MAPSAGGATAQRTRHTTIEERSFARLDDDSLKSADEDDPSSPYELESHLGKRDFIATPPKSYASVSHRERAR